MGREYEITFDCPEFTALCPITGQPDFGRIEIRYVPDRECLESKSLKLYLFAFRNQGTFHEAVVNRILDDVVKAIRPRKAVVLGDFNARGGIALRVEATFPGPRRVRGSWWLRPRRSRSCRRHRRMSTPHLAPSATAATRRSRTRRCPPRSWRRCGRRPETC
jgi:7-cyano-7-deazaguanine reductase